MIRRTFLVMVALMALVVASGCTSSSSGKSQHGQSAPSPPTDPKTHWNVAGSATLDGVVAKIKAAMPGQCGDWGLYGEGLFLVNSRRAYKFASPEAVGRCQVLTDSVDIAAFANQADTLDWAKNHGEIFCKLAANAKVGLPGIDWVVGKRWTAQPDGEGVGRRLAAAVPGAKFLFTACPGPNRKSWDDAGVAHAAKIAATLDHAGLGCSDFLLEDRGLLLGNPHYVETGLPSAFGRCAIKGTAGGVIQTFDNSSIDQATYATKELAFVCRQLPTTQMLVLPKALVFVPNPTTVAAVATALGVADSPRRCGTP